MSRSARRVEQLALAAELRGRGLTVAEVARALRERYGINARLAARTARGWSQADVATAWNQRWPDEPKTFKNVSYWENWPSPTGHAPSLAVLDRLARLYECDVADLLAGWGEHAPTRAAPGSTTEPETLAWQVEHLDLHELTRSVSDWAGHLPPQQRRALLLKLSTAASVTATNIGSDRAPRAGLSAGARSLSGLWSSTYSYHSTSRDRDLVGEHTVELGADRGRLVGRSLPHPTGSELRLDLSVGGSLVTGSWTERTSPTGHYRAGTYHGLLQLVLDPTGHSMAGKWTGISKRYTIKAGGWRLERLAESGDGPVTTATTTEDASTSPLATSANRANIILPT